MSTAAESVFERLFESSPDGIVLVDVDGHIQGVNGQVESMFGYDREALIGGPIEVLLPERLQERHVHHRNGCRDDPRMRPMGAGLDLFGKRKDGSEFPVDIMLSPIQTESGRLVLGVVRDVTERKRFERALKEKNIELENAILARDRFLASMSHELRTPLNAIIGFTGTLLMRLPGPLTADQEKQLRTIQGSAKHLLSLINDLLDLAKIESGKLELHLEAVGCQRVIDEVASALRPLAESKGLTSSIDTQPNDIVILTDRRALSQIIINLTNNAIKFTEHGSVRLALDQQHDKGRTLTRVTVTDTGVGIRDEDQMKLFQAFTQVGSSGTRRHEGTGLGLHVSQKLAGLLGGQITFGSEHGKGSTFTLTLPEK